MLVFVGVGTGEEVDVGEGAGVVVAVTVGEGEGVDVGEGVAVEVDEGEGVSVGEEVGLLEGGQTGAGAVGEGIVSCPLTLMAAVAREINTERPRMHTIMMMIASTPPKSSCFEGC